MTTHKKTGPLLGVGRWEKLENIGDCKRFFRWCILSLKDGKLDRQTASILGQLGTYLLRAIEGSDVEARLSKLEEKERHGSTYEATEET